MTKPTILCVDDEYFILESLKEQLQRSFGNLYLYEIAEDPEEALEIIEELNEEGMPIVVIISDWLMPKMKGDEFLIEVHNNFPNIVKIMLTGQADDKAIEKAKTEANLYGFLVKPWTQEDIINLINSALAAPIS